MRFVLVVAALALVACGQTTYETAAVPDETSTSTTVLYDGRLHVAVVPQSYANDSEALNWWRMDPAPVDQHPTLTVEQVRASFEASDFGRGLKARYYFGLYTGNEPNPNAPDGKLTGVHPVTDVPAWLVFIDDQTFTASGGASPPGRPQPSAVPVHGWAWTQLRDAPGASMIAGFEQTGGEPPPIY